MQVRDVIEALKALDPHAEVVVKLQANIAIDPTGAMPVKSVTVEGKIDAVHPWGNKVHIEAFNNRRSQ